MAEVEKSNIYKNILGDAKLTIEAIQRYIAENSKLQNTKNEIDIEESPADSINRILNSTICEDTNRDIQQIIKNL